MIRGVRWFSIVPGSGFGNSSEDYMRGLRDAGIQVGWVPMGWGADVWHGRLGPLPDPAPLIEGREHEDIANRSFENDTLVVHSTPLWHDQLELEAKGKRLAVYTAWESDRLPRSSVDVLNRYSRVIVPSLFNASVFEASGVEVPISVVPHIARVDGRARHLPVGTRTHDGTFVFYTIGSWSVRKALADLVEAYLAAFTRKDSVVLVVHTTADDYIALSRPEDERDGADGGAARRARWSKRRSTDRSKRRSTDRSTGRGTDCSTGRGTDCSTDRSFEGASWHALLRILAGRANAPEIVLSTRELSRSEIDQLHRDGDCFVSLSRGEGWGLGPFEAASFGKPVIVTGWSATLEYLPDDYPYLVEYDLVPSASDGPDYWRTPGEDDRWAKARIPHAASVMRHVFEHRHEAAELGAALRARVTEEFCSSKVTELLVEALENTELRPE